MVVRALFTAALVTVLAGCGGGGDGDDRGELRLLAPAGLVGDPTPFERRTNCRVDLRVYDEDEDISLIAKRRDVDVVARPARPGETPHDTTDLVRIAIERNLEIVVPERVAAAYDGRARPAGRRSTRWELRRDGPNPECAGRWLADVTSR